MMYVCMRIYHLYFIAFPFNQVTDEDGFVGDIRTQSSDTQEAVDEYDTPRLVKARKSRHI